MFASSKQNIGLSHSFLTKKYGHKFYSCSFVIEKFRKNINYKNKCPCKITKLILKEKKFTSE